jgi:hypothetical protein
MGLVFVMTEFDLYPPDTPATAPPPPATPGALPHVKIHGENDGGPVALPYEEAGDTSVLGVDPALEAAMESEPDTASHVGRATVAAEAEDPRRRPITVPIPGKDAGAGADAPRPDEKREPTDVPPAAEVRRTEVELASFEPYRPQMDDIDRRLEAGDDPATIPGYVTTGSKCHIFRTEDGKLLKLPRVTQHDEETEQPYELPPTTAHDQYIEPLSRVKGREGYEQIHAATEEGRGGVVVETAPGKPLDQLTEDELDAIPVPHFKQLLRAYQTGVDAAVEPGQGSDNFIYDRDTGFTIINPSTTEAAGTGRTADELAREFSQGPITQREDRLIGDDLPPSAENFYAAYEEVFGPEAGQTLQEEFFDRGWNVTETSGFTNTVVVPRDIGDLLDKATPAEVRQGATIKLNLRDYPQLLARQEGNISYESLVRGKQAVDALIEHGVKVLPSRPIEHHDATYIITQWVDGKPLEEALAAGEAGRRLLNQIDRTWTGLTNGLVRALETNRPFPGDIVGPQQYMVGTTPYDPTVDVRLVDLPNSASPPREALEYEQELLEITSGVVRMEQVMGFSLDGAHEAIEAALQRARFLPIIGDAYTRAIRHMLDTGEAIDPADTNRILSFHNAL